MWDRMFNMGEDIPLYDMNNYSVNYVFPDNAIIPKRVLYSESYNKSENNGVYSDYYKGNIIS